MKAAQIVLVEDCQSYREVIALGLNNRPDFEVAAEFNTADAALDYLQDHKPPSLILLDLNLPGRSGLQAIPDFQAEAPKTKILVLTESEKEADILEALTAGAQGYLLKESPFNQIITGIYNVLSGGASLDPTMARYLLEQHRPKVNDLSFSERELEVLELVAEGLIKKEIAKQLNLSPKTIDFHVGQIYKKFEVHNAPAAVAKAYQSGTLPRPKQEPL